MAITYNLIINNKTKEDGTHLILLRVTENRKHQAISTGMSIPFKDFNKKADAGKWIRKTNPRHVKLNEELESKINELKDAKTKLLKNIAVVTSKQIIAEAKHKNTDSFIDYWEGILPVIKQSKSYNFYKNSVSKLKNLNQFLKGKDLLFTEVDYAFLSRYEAYMKKKGSAKNTIYTNLKTIRIYFYRAIKEKRLQVFNPFNDFVLKEEAGHKQRLDKGQIMALEALKIENGTTLWHSRNYFLFSFYCAGIRVGDFIQLKWGNINGDQLIYNMDKTREKQELELTEKAVVILNYYKPKKVALNNFIFPLLNNEVDYKDAKFLNSQISSKTALINKNLKKLASVAGILSNLTFHVSRHSYADILIKSGASIYDLKGLLRHSSTNITEKYIASLDNDASNKAHKKAMDF